jgi:hypothetical protein
MIVAIPSCGTSAQTYNVELSDNLAIDGLSAG